MNTTPSGGSAPESPPTANPPPEVPPTAAPNPPPEAPPTAAPPPDAPKAGTYVKSVAIETEQDPRAIRITAAENAPELPDPLRNLYDEIRVTARVARNLYSRDFQARRDIFAALYYAADTGLRGERIRDGGSNLDEARRLIADLFPSTRNKIWTSYLLWVLLVAAPFALIGLILLYIADEKKFGDIHPVLTSFNKNGVYSTQFLILLALVWVTAGTVVGVFLEFIFTVDADMQYSDVQKVNPARWLPAQRVVNTAFLGWIFAFFLGAGVLKVGVLNVLLNDFMVDKRWMLLVTGLLTGFSYSYVKNIIYSLRPVVKD